VLVAGLVVGWLLLLAWGALVAWNASTAGARVSLARLIALPSLPGLPSDLATQAAPILAVLAPLLLVVLVALTFAPLSAPEAKPAPPAKTTPSVAPRPDATARSPLPLGGARAEGNDPSGAERAQREVASGLRVAPLRFTPWVFISHSSADDGFGRRLAADLRAALAPTDPQRVWYDSAPERGEEGADDITQLGGLVAGMNFPREIVEQITTRNVAVVILSPEAVRSRWVRYEIDQAINRYNGPERFAIYPVVYRACALPKPLGIFQTLDFTHADDDPAAYQRQLGALAERIREGRVDLSESAPPFDLGLLPEPPRLIGRDAELAWALDRLRARETTAVTALRGMGGIGKSALAAVAIRQLRQERAFPDGIAVVLCENLTDPVDVLRQALSRFAAGGRAPDADDLPALAATAQQLLAGKRALITLDNIEPALPIEQVTGPLAAAGATLLLTARQMLPVAAVPVDGVRRLDLLAPDDALLLFAQSYGRLDADALSGEARAAATRIVSLLDRHTLAVRLAGAYAAELGRPLPRVAEEIASDVLRIPEGETPRKVEAALARSVNALAPDGQWLFVALAAFATGEFGRQAALALARGLALADPEASVELLVRRALLDASLDARLPANADAERLRLHPLLQAEAAQQIASWSAADREQADRALAAWYGDYTNTAPDLALTPDEANIIGALAWALAHDDDRAISDICNGMRGFWRDTGRTRAGLRYLPPGAAAAGRIAEKTGERADRLVQANITAYLGDILTNTGRLDEAEAIYRQDLDLRCAIEDRQGEGVVLSRLGQVALRRGRLEEAADYFQQSLPILRETQDRQGEGVDLATIGQIAEARGEYVQAARAYHEGIAALREVGDRINIAAISEALGAVLLQHLGDHAGGCAAFAEAVALWREIGLADREQAAREWAQRLGCAG